MSKGRKKDSKRSPTSVATPKVAKPRLKAAPSKSTAPAAPQRGLTFGPDTYKWIGIGFGLVVLGLILMSGSRGDNFTEFDTDVIYSPVKLTVAPLLMLGGLGIVIYAILKK